MYYCTLIIYEYIEHHCHIIIIKDVRDMLITFNNDNNDDDNNNNNNNKNYNNNNNKNNNNNNNKNNNNNNNNNNSEFKSQNHLTHSQKTNFWERLFFVLF